MLGLYQPMINTRNPDGANNYIAIIIWLHTLAILLLTIQPYISGYIAKNQKPLPALAMYSARKLAMSHDYNNHCYIACRFGYIYQINRALSHELYSQSMAIYSQRLYLDIQSITIKACLHLTQGRQEIQLFYSHELFSQIYLARQPYSYTFIGQRAVKSTRWQP